MISGVSAGVCGMGRRWNPRPVSRDYRKVRCESCREALSARLDGEDNPADEEGAAERDAVEDHLASCADCRGFLDDAAWVTRLTRTGLAEPGPDLVGRVLAAAPRPWRGRFTRVVQVLVGLLGAGQLALAGVALFVMHGPMAQHGQPATLGGATMTHMSHEAAAWNLAIGVGFLWAALRSTRSAGLVPMLAAFVALLTLLSVIDLAEGKVDVLRLVSHLLVVAGLALVVLLDRTRAGGGGSTPARGSRRGDPHGGTTSQEPADVAGQDRTGLRPTARHHAA